MSCNNELGAFRVVKGWQIFLVSGSPRRRDLLSGLGLEFSILKPDVIEPRPEWNEEPEAYCMRCARVKTQGCRIELDAMSDLAIIGADTIVVKDNEIIGKPCNSADALEILHRLVGTYHTVFTAMNVNINGREFSRVSRTKVWFHPWPDKILQAYVATGDPLDKAGAYGIQGIGSFLVEKVDGSPTNVTGLPLGQLLSILIENGCVRPYGEES